MSKGRYFIRQQKYICGNYLEVSMYPVFQRTGKRRKKCRPSTAIQKRLNQKNREKKLTRLVHANFTENDIILHLTYKITPAEEEAKRQLRNFLRRLQRLRIKKGLDPLKYISITEIGKRGGRIHHHVFINGGIDRDEVEKCWGKGYANSKRLQFDDVSGIEALTHYVLKDPVSFRAWNSSKNLIKPEPIIIDGEISAKELRKYIAAIEEKKQYETFEKIYPGYCLLEVEYEKNIINYGDYIYLRLKRNM